MWHYLKIINNKSKNMKNLTKMIYTSKRKRFGLMFHSNIRFPFSLNSQQLFMYEAIYLEPYKKKKNLKAMLHMYTITFHRIIRQHHWQQQSLQVWNHLHKLHPHCLVVAHHFERERQKELKPRLDNHWFTVWETKLF